MCVHTCMCACMYHAHRHIIHIIYRYAHVANCKKTSNQPAYVCKPHIMFCNTKNECTQVNHLNNLQSLFCILQNALLNTNVFTDLSNIQAEEYGQNYKQFKLWVCSKFPSNLGKCCTCPVGGKPTSSHTCTHSYKVNQLHHTHAPTHFRTCIKRMTATVPVHHEKSGNKVYFLNQHLHIIPWALADFNTADKVNEKKSSLDVRLRSGKTEGIVQHSTCLTCMGSHLDIIIAPAAFSAISLLLVSCM